MSDRGPNPHVFTFRSTASIPVAAIAVGLALAAIVLRPLPPTSAGTYTGRAGLAIERLSSSPAELDAYLTLVELGLDNEGGRTLWKRAAAGARHLAPNLAAPEQLYVRSGLLHWYELSNEERATVLSAAASLLRDETGYRNLWRPVLAVTRSPSFLAQNVPDDSALEAHVRDLAASWGDFTTYRRLSREIQQSLLAERRSMEIQELVPAFERLEVNTANLGLARVLSDEIAGRPRPIAAWETRITNARIRWSQWFPHAFPPAESTESVRIRTLEPPLETQIHGSAIWSLPERTRRVVIEAESPGTGSSPAMIEAWVDGQLMEARVLDSGTSFALELTPGRSLLELRLASRRGRNGEPLQVGVRIEEGT